MTWIIDRNRNFSMISVKILKIMYKHGFNRVSANDPCVVKAIEEDFSRINVHASLNRQIKTNLKNFLCLDENYDFTEVAKCLIRDDISLNEAALYIISSFTVKNDYGKIIFPLKFIIRALLKLEKNEPGNAYLTPYDFEYLSHLDSADDITDDVIHEMIKDRKYRTLVSWSNSNMDILKNILLTSRLFSGDTFKIYLRSFLVANWIDDVYKGLSYLKGNGMSNGIFRNMPIRKISEILK